MRFSTDFLLSVVKVDSISFERALNWMGHISEHSWHFKQYLWTNYFSPFPSFFMTSSHFTQRKVSLFKTPLKYLYYFLNSNWVKNVKARSQTWNTYLTAPMLGQLSYPRDSVGIKKKYISKNFINIWTKIWASHKVK